MQFICEEPYLFCIMNPKVKNTEFYWDFCAEGGEFGSWFQQLLDLVTIGSMHSNRKDRNEKPDVHFTPEQVKTIINELINSSLFKNSARSDLAKLGRNDPMYKKLEKYLPIELWRAINPFQTK